MEEAGELKSDNWNTEWQMRLLFSSVRFLLFNSSFALCQLIVPNELFAGEYEDGGLVVIVIGWCGEIGEVYWCAEAFSDFVPC